MHSREAILETLLELTSRSGSRTRAGTLEQLLRTAVQITGADAAAVLTTFGRELERYVLRTGPNRGPVVRGPGAASELSRLLLRTGHPITLADLSSEKRFAESDQCGGLDCGPSVFVPLRLRENAPGYLAVYRRKGAAVFDASIAQSLVLLSAWAGATLESLRLGESVERLAVTDDLTQVYNFRFLKTALRREIKRAGRFRQELAIIMIDVDNLKAYNDRHGHLRGSFLLKEAAGLLAAQVRSFDLVAKYGGDEFTLILPQTGFEGALSVAERVRASVATHAFPLAPAGSITVSLGVAVFPHDASEGNGLIQASDRALYRAKKAGRNRVESLREEAA